MCVGLDVPNNMSVIMWRRYYASHFLFLWICLRLNANVSEMDAGCLLATTTLMSMLSFSRLSHRMRRNKLLDVHESYFSILFFREA